MAKTALVVGATGSQGKPTAYALLEAGWAVRALTRDPARAGDLVERGAEPVAGDLRDLRTLQKAVDGADAVYYHTPMGVAGPSGGADEQAAVQLFAQAPGVHLVVNTGFALPEGPIGVPMLDERVQFVRRLLEQGATALIPTAYMENLSATLVTSPRRKWGAGLPTACRGPHRLGDVQRRRVGNGRRPRQLGDVTRPVLPPGRPAGARVHRSGGDARRRPGPPGGLPPDHRHGVRPDHHPGARRRARHRNRDGVRDQMPPFPNPLLAPNTTPARTELGVLFTPLAAWVAQQDWTG